MDMEAKHKGRTDFLTILCVLSLIGSTFLVVTGINQYREADLTSALIRQQMDKGNVKVNLDKGKGDDAERARKVMQEATNMISPEKIKKYALGSIITSLLTLSGAFMMFRLKKIGFWTYVVGTLAFAAVPFWVYGLNNPLAYGMGMFFAGVGLVFVVLYARNLKFMN
ncbi:MAG: hypothetical protein EAZ17_01510 [Sphingobacteriales bacterium]|nr:MAG: hypothetical protein EAZ17_01510 [Sphingobacteriales bacterium]